MDQEFIKTYVEAIIKVLPDGQKRPMIIVFENRKSMQLTALGESLVPAPQR